MAFFSFPERVNEYAARIVAGSVATLLVLGFALRVPLVIPVLATGFLLRVGWGPRFSPLARIAMNVAPRIWPAKPVAGPPKRFAQGIGAFCTVLATGLLLAGHAVAAWSVAGVIVLFAMLEAAIPFCMGCWIFGKLQAAGLVAPEVCVDCAPTNSKVSGP